VKKNSYQYYMAKLGTDVNAVKQAVEGKKALEELQRTHISLE
jgi:DNA primase